MPGAGIERVPIVERFASLFFVVVVQFFIVLCECDIKFKVFLFVMVLKIFVALVRTLICKNFQNRMSALHPTPLEPARTGVVLRRGARLTPMWEMSYFRPL